MIRNVIKMGHQILMSPANRVKLNEFNTTGLADIVQDMTDMFTPCKRGRYCCQPNWYR